MRRRMGRPGLLGTMARTAVIAGTATAVSERVRGRQEAAVQAQAVAADSQAQMESMQAQLAAMQAPPAPPQAPADDLVAQIERLGSLRAAGALTDGEFAAAKAKLLGL